MNHSSHILGQTGDGTACEGSEKGWGEGAERCHTRKSERTRCGLGGKESEWSGTPRKVRGVDEEGNTKSLEGRKRFVPEISGPGQENIDFRRAR